MNQEAPHPFLEHPEPAENPPSPSLQLISHSATPSETQGEAEVAAILHFGNSCSISLPEDEANTISASSGIDRNDKGVEAAPIVVEDAHDWLPASSPLPPLFSDDMMEVDQPAWSCQESRSGSEPVLLSNRGRSRSLEVVASLDVKPPDFEVFEASEHRAGPLDLGDDDAAVPHGEVDPLSFYGRRSTRHSIGKTYSRMPEPKNDPIDEPVEIVSVQNERERYVSFVHERMILKTCCQDLHIYIGFSGVATPTGHQNAP